MHCNPELLAGCVMCTLYIAKRGYTLNLLHQQQCHILSHLVGIHVQRVSLRHTAL